MNITPPRWLVKLLLHLGDRHPLPSLYGADGSLYMIRNTVFRTKYIWARMHITYRGDQDPERHDHPWLWCMSWILENGYMEDQPDGVHIRRKGDIVFRGQHAQHRLDLLFDQKPCLSLFITGPWRQMWGFFLEDGTKVPWKVFLSRKGRNA